MHTWIDRSQGSLLNHFNCFWQIKWKTCIPNKACIFKCRTDNCYIYLHIAQQTMTHRALPPAKVVHSCRLHIRFKWLYFQLFFLPKSVSRFWYSYAQISPNTWGYKIWRYSNTQIINVSNIHFPVCNTQQYQISCVSKRLQYLCFVPSLIDHAIGRGTPISSALFATWCYVGADSTGNALTSLWIKHAVFILL